MSKSLPKNLLKYLKEINMTEEEATWKVHGTPVLLHKACEKMASLYNIVFDVPTIYSLSLIHISEPTRR